MSAKPILHKTNKKIKNLYYCYFILLTLIIILRFTLFARPDEGVRMILFGIFVIITWVPCIIYFNKTNRVLLELLSRRNSIAIKKITYFGKGEHLNMRGVFIYLFSKDDLNDPEIGPIKADAKKILNIILLQFGLFFPVGIIVVTPM